MTQLNFNSANLKTLFREVGLYSPKEQFYPERVHKHQQVFVYIVQIKTAFSKLSTKKPIVLLDCGCGRSYLSFILYEYCQTVLNRQIKIIGIDNNADLINKCKKTAQELGFENMEFYHSDVEKFKTDEIVDIVYALHACDTATDQTIAKGVMLNAKYIFSVSCCQYTNRKEMSKHPLQSISRHQPYKERLVDMIGDSMRALLLEHLGYGVKLFEFVAAEYTPKNIMLRAIKNTVKRQDKENAEDNYNKLVAMFNFFPALENYLREFVTL
jgi:SAM-dependent methyltransferase